MAEQGRPLVHPTGPSEFFRQFLRGGGGPLDARPRNRCPLNHWSANTSAFRERRRAPPPRSFPPDCPNARQRAGSAAPLGTSVAGRGVYDGYYTAHTAARVPVPGGEE